MNISTTHRSKPVATLNSVTAPFLLILALFAIDPRNLPATTYYVDQNHPNATDSNPGTSENAPWRTLQRAMSVIAGDTVYVKNGTYSSGTGELNLANSGTASAPIAIRAYTPTSSARHRPVLTRSSLDPNGLDFVIGSRQRDYITWDGFVLDAGKLILVGRGTGVIFENIEINAGSKPCQPGNLGGFYVDGSTGLTIRNSIIRGPNYGAGTSTGCYTTNAAAIWMIRASNIYILNNDISDAGSGIDCKRICHDVIIERNYIHDSMQFGRGISLGVASDASCTGDGCRTSDFTIRNNIIHAGQTAIAIDAGPGSIARNLHFFNNTIYGAQYGFIGAVQNTSATRFYNNIVHRNTAVGGYHIQFFGTPPSDLLSNYSMFFDSVGNNGRFTANSGELTLSQWRTNFGLDLNSQTNNPNFVGPLTDTPLPSAFQLRPDSPAINAGRIGGVSTGAAVNLGAYALGSEVVGPGSGTNEPGTSVPAAPTGLVVTQ